MGIAQKKTFSVFFKARFNSQINTKYASLLPSDVTSDLENCSEVRPGDSRDGYLKSVLCLTYFNLLKSYDLRLVQSEEEFRSKKTFSIEYVISEDQEIANKIWSWSNLLTLTIIPYWGQREFKLAILEQQGDQVISERVFNAHFTEYRSIILLPAMPFTDGYKIGTRKAVSNLLSQVDEHFQNFDKKK